MTKRLILPRFSIRSFSSSPLTSSFRRGSPTESAKKTKLSAATILEDESKGVFRVLDIDPPKKQARKQFKQAGANDPVPPARETRMKPDQSWGDVWPAARTFHPAVVPLPVRQGVTQTKAHVVPSKWANAELMKIPNFLHLTPPVVTKHCAALSKFCTPWPKALATDEDVDKHFPLTVITSDHLNSNSSIRDRRSRIVTIRFHLDSLQLDSHARDKFIRLVGERYDEESGIVTLTADRCPYRGQNKDYTEYLLTALFHESWRVEDWETKEHPDQEQFFAHEKGERQALEDLLNQGEDDISLLRYREEARKLMGLPAQVVEGEAVGME